MAVTATPVFPQAIHTAAVALTTSYQAVYTPGANGSKIDALIVTSTDATARDLTLAVQISAADYVIGTVSIPITAGTINSAPSVDLLRNSQIPCFAYDAFGNKCLYLANGSVLRAKISSGTSVQIFIQGADF